MSRLVAAALESPKVGRDQPRTVQLVLDCEGEIPETVLTVASTLGAAPRVKTRKPPSRRIPALPITGGITRRPGRALLRVPLGNEIPLVLGLGRRGHGAPLPDGVSVQTESVPQAHPVGLQDQAARHPPDLGAPVVPPAAPEADLRGLKREVERLPRHHPMRLAVHGEPDRMPRAELVLKMKEWSKYLGWQDSP